VRLYETGIKYLNSCKIKLEEAETKISILSLDLPKLKDKEEEDGF
jgi:exonuclease VII small subunit